MPETGSYHDTVAADAIGLLPTLKADAGGVVDWMLGGTKKKDKGGSAKRSAMKY